MADVFGELIVLKIGKLGVKEVQKYSVVTHAGFGISVGLQHS